MTNQEIKDSLTRQVSSPLSDNIIEVPITTTTIKKFKGGDLPLYFKWDVDHTTWIYRVRIKNGRTIADMLQTTSDGIELKYVTLGSAFSNDNKPITEDEWRNEMHKFIKQIRD